MDNLKYMEAEYIGAVKIRDGLFIGDKATSQDLDFIVSSKITHIINTSSSEVSNEWVSLGITYLSFLWEDSETQIIFEENSDTFEKCYTFIEDTLELGESVLINSVRGESRCVCVVLGFLMKKYKWALTKSLEFLNSRKPDCKIKPNFLFQLVKLENSLVRSLGFPLSKIWDKTEDIEETILRNTYLNSRPGNFCFLEPDKNKKKTKLKWADGGKNIKSKLEINGFKNPIENGLILLKSCVKGKKDKILVQPPKSVKSSRSVNTLTVKNFSDSAKEYGSFEDLKVRKVVRTNSVSKRENSPFLRDFKKIVPKTKKKLPAFALLGFVEIAKGQKKDTGSKGRAGSARPPSPFSHPPYLSNLRKN